MNNPSAFRLCLGTFLAAAALFCVIQLPAEASASGTAPVTSPSISPESASAISTASSAPADSIRQTVQTAFEQWIQSNRSELFSADDFEIGNPAAYVRTSMLSGELHTQQLTRYPMIPKQNFTGVTIGVLVDRNGQFAGMDDSLLVQRRQTQRQLNELLIKYQLSSETGLPSAGEIDISNPGDTGLIKLEAERWLDKIEERAMVAGTSGKGWQRRGNYTVKETNGVFELTLISRDEEPVGTLTFDRSGQLISQSVSWGSIFAKGKPETTPLNPAPLTEAETRQVFTKGKQYLEFLRSQLNAKAIEKWGVSSALPDWRSIQIVQIMPSPDANGIMIQLSGPSRPYTIEIHLNKRKPEGNTVYFFESINVTRLDISDSIQMLELAPNPSLQKYPIGKLTVQSTISDSLTASVLAKVKQQAPIIHRSQPYLPFYAEYQDFKITETFSGLDESGKAVISRTLTAYASPMNRLSGWIMLTVHFKEDWSIDTFSILDTREQSVKEKDYFRYAGQNWSKIRSSFRGELTKATKAGEKEQQALREKIRKQAEETFDQDADLLGYVDRQLQKLLKTYSPGGKSA